MAGDLKISQLPSATAIQGTELVPIVQGGTTSQTTTDGMLNRAADIGGCTVTFTRLNLVEAAGGSGTIQNIVMDSHDDAGVTKANLRVFGTGGGVSGNWITTGGLQVQTGFGCNTKLPQTAVTVNAASTDLPSVIALCNQLRAALIANGICQ